MHLLVALFAGCPETSSDGVDAAEIPVLAPPASEDGFQIAMFGTAPANTEAWLCSVYDLPTTADAAVHAVQYLQNDGTHHLTLSTTAFSKTPLEPGDYDCQDLYSNSSVMQDMVMMFGNQGEAEGTLTLPDGVAATLPAGLQVLQEIHYVNTTDKDIPLYSYINALTIPPDEVVDGIWGGSVRDENIDIPAGGTHTEWSRCVMNEDVEVQFLASHTHALATEFTIAPFDGVNTGEVMYTNYDWHDPKIVQYNPGMVVPAGQGFEWSCTWANPTDNAINYGFLSTDEMCNMAVVFTPFSVTAACEVVETSDGVLWEG